VGLISFAGVLNAFDITSPTALARVQAETRPPLVAPQEDIDESRDEADSLNYDIADTSSDFSNNSGGPITNIRLSNVDSAAEEQGIENELRAIETNGSPDFIPSIWAHLGKINNEFGFRRNPFGGRSFEFHPGIDVDGEKGDVVVATANGVVIKAGWTGGYGNLIELDHGNGLKTRYGHMSKIEVAVGDIVQRGEQMGLIGSTGRSTGPHLHFELRLFDRPINPRRFLPPEPTEIPQTQ
jgi:murein DD-endopeptidase MepM/ murein hydrolase activator NlpD